MPNLENAYRCPACSTRATAVFHPNDERPCPVLVRDWKAHLAQAEVLTRMSEEAEVSGDYREYDELCTDHWELGNDLAHRFADLLGLTDA